MDRAPQKEEIYESKVQLPELYSFFAFPVNLLFLESLECSHPLLASEYLSIFAGSRTYTYIGQVVNFFP